MKTSSARTLFIFLCLVAIFSAIDAHFFATERTLPHWWRISSMLVLSATVFAWYYYDSNEIGFKRSSLLNISFVVFAALAAPYYLFQARKDNWPLTLIKLLVFICLNIIAVLLGSFVYALFG